jgi:hypothetical protein
MGRTELKDMGRTSCVQGAAWRNSKEVSMPILSEVKKRPPELKKNEVLMAMIIEDDCVFNLPTLIAGMGFASEETAKKWCMKYGAYPVTQGRTWLFTGKRFREALEAYDDRRAKANKASA